MRKVRYALLSIGLAVATSLGCGTSAMADASSSTADSRSATEIAEPSPGVLTGESELKGYKDQSGNVIDASEEQEMQTAGIRCTPYTGVDYPHISGSEFWASGHGWWKVGTCDTGTAHVTSCLYEWYTDGFFYQKACKTRKVKPGTGKRANARVACGASVKTTWTNRVDVDVDGQLDTGEVDSKKLDIYCRTAS